MREGDYANNRRLARRFGAFSSPGPTTTPCPPPPSSTRTSRTGRNALPVTVLVVQNYRLISRDGRILWKPGGPRTAIAAVGVDAEGRILFLHCREPLDAYSFARGAAAPAAGPALHHVCGRRRAGRARAARGQHRTRLCRTQRRRNSCPRAASGSPCPMCWARGGGRPLLNRGRPPADADAANKKNPVNKQKGFTGGTE